MSTYSDQIDVVLRDRLIPKMQSVSKDMATVEQYSYGSSQLLSLKRQSDYYSMIYDFLKEYLVGSEQIDNDKLINIVRLLENPDSERKGMDFLGTQPEKKQKVKSGYTMYINGIEVGPETDITPGSVITIIIVYGSSQNITGNKSLEITSGTLNQTTDGFTIILQNLFVPVSAGGTFLEINAQAKENGIPLDAGNLFRLPIGNVQNVNGTIILTTTLNGVFNLLMNGLTGSGTINWGDASPIEPFTFTGVAFNVTHAFSGVGNTITISAPLSLTLIRASNMHVTSAVIPSIFTKVESIDLSVNDMTSFTTHKEWVELNNLSLSVNQLTLVATYKEWVNLTLLDVSFNNLSSLSTFDSWTALTQISFGSNAGITQVNTYATWISLSSIYGFGCSLSSIDTFQEWVDIQYIYLQNNSIAAIDTFSTWTSLSELNLTNNQLVTIDTYPEWIDFRLFAIDGNPLIYFNAYRQWSNIQHVTASFCELTNINDVLIELDNTLIGAGGEIRLDSGTNMGPFGLGLVAYNSLATKGLTALTTNTEQFMSDVQGNQYAYRTIGTQVWTVENLKTQTYNDGSPINNVTVDNDWITATGVTGASDWFLPSSSELVEMWSQLHFYGVGGFTTGAQYWTSSEFGPQYAYRVRFDAGSSVLYSGLKTDLIRVRSCRIFTKNIAYPLRSLGLGGGLVFKVIDNLNGTWTMYEAAPSDQSASISWSNVTSIAVGTTGTTIGTGHANTLAIVTQAGGASDWFLPSEDELTAMYTELYLHSLGGFIAQVYFSSTENAPLVRALDFSIGSTLNYGKHDSQRKVRPCRSFTTSTIYALRDVGPAGGYIFHIVNNGGGSFTYYESGTVDLTDSYWSDGVGTIGTTGSAIGTGQTNTTAIISQPGHTASAALECDQYVFSFAFSTGAAKLSTDLITTGNSGAYCWYNNSLTNKDVLGALYNWYAVDKSKRTNPMGDEYGALYNWYVVGYNTGGASIAPAGWHVPTKTEWDTLGAYLGGIFSAGTHMKETGSTHWTPSGGDNTSGFSSRGSGGRNSVTGTYSSLNTGFFCWSSTVGTPGAYYEYENQAGSAIMSSAIRSPNYGQSIRLIKDDSIDPGTMTDFDGNIYPTVTIGTQVWMQTSLKVTHLNDGVAIYNITDNTEWANTVVPAMCYYNNTPDVYVPLLAPAGWHIPTITEINTLIAYLGGALIAGGTMKEMGLWRWSSNIGANNSSRLTINPAGGRLTDGTFFGNSAFIYSSTPQSSNTSAHDVGLNSYSATVSVATTDTRNGLSVRLIKD